MSTESQRARSRLSKPATLTQSHPSQENDPGTPSLLVRYLQQLPTAVVAIPGWAGVWLVLTQLPPTVGQHWLFANSFLPVTVTLAWTLFFSVSFILLHSRRGLWVTVGLLTLLSLKLQRVSLNWQAVIAIVGFFGILELVLISIASLFTRHENLRTTPHSKPRNSHN